MPESRGGEPEEQIEGRGDLGGGGVGLLFIPEIRKSRAKEKIRKKIEICAELIDPATNIPKGEGNLLYPLVWLQKIRMPCHFWFILVLKKKNLN